MSDLSTSPPAFDPRPTVNHEQCPVCGGHRIASLYPMEMMQGKEGPFEYRYCEDCESTYQAHLLPDYSRFYSQSYYSFKFDEPSTLSQRFRQIKRRLRNRYYYFGEGLPGRLLAWLKPCPVNHLSQHIRLQRGTSILEIGCGSGELLHEVADIGVHRAVGIDPFLSGNRTYRSGAQIYKSKISELANHVGEQKFDVILFNHALEHSPAPFEDLKEVSRYLKPRGEILIRIPVSGSEVANTYKEHWWSLDAPRHIYLFSNKSMPLLAQRCGLALKRTHFEGTIDDYLASEQHRAGVRLLDDASYVVSKNFSAFSKEQLIAYAEKIAMQNNNGTAALAGFVLGFPCEPVP